LTEPVTLATVALALSRAAKIMVMTSVPNIRLLDLAEQQGAQQPTLHGGIVQRRL
jgi:hypothetical protein